MKRLRRILTVMLALTMVIGLVTPMSVQAATTRKCTMTFSQSLAGLNLSSSNSNVAKITKVNDSKYVVSDVAAGKTVTKATVNGKTYKTTVKISVNSKGYPTLTFTADDNMTITTTNKNIISVKSSDISNGVVRYTIKFKTAGTATLKLAVNGVNCGSCKCKIE